MPLRDGLGQGGDGLRGEGEVAGRPGDALPALHPAEAESRQVREHGQCHDGVDHLPVSAEHGLQVTADAGALGDPLQKPDVPVQPVPLLSHDGGASRAAPVRKPVQQAQVPAVRKDEAGALLPGKGKELRPWDESAVLDDAVVQMAAYVPSVLAGHGALDAGVCVPVGGVRHEAVGCLRVDGAWHAAPPVWWIKHND